MSKYTCCVHACMHASCSCARVWHRQSTPFYSHSFFLRSFCAPLRRTFATCHFVSRGSDEFADCLAPVSENTNAVVPNHRRKMGANERLAWLTSCNFQRERHPLVQMQAARKKRLTAATKTTTTTTVRTSLAEPTAVHASVLQSQGSHHGNGVN